MWTKFWVRQGRAHGHRDVLQRDSHCDDGESSRPRRIGMQGLTRRAAIADKGPKLPQLGSAAHQTWLGAQTAGEIAGTLATLWRRSTLSAAAAAARPGPTSPLLVLLVFLLTMSLGAPHHAVVCEAWMQTRKWHCHCCRRCCCQCCWDGGRARQACPGPASRATCQVARQGLWCTRHHHFHCIRCRCPPGSL